MGNFDRENFDTFQPDHQNLTDEYFKAIQGLEDSDHPSKYFPKSQYPSKFPPYDMSLSFKLNELHQNKATMIYNSLSVLLYSSRVHAH